MDEKTAHELIWNGIAYALVAGGSLATLLGLYLGIPSLRQRWLPLPRLRPGTWTGHDVFLAVCIFYGFQSIIVGLLYTMGFFVPLLGPAPDSDPPNADFRHYLGLCTIISSPLMLAVILGVLFLVMFARTATRPHHYGLSWGRWPANLALGLLGFIVATPVIFAPFALLSLLGEPQPHPLVALGQPDSPWWMWALIGFQAIVVAPLLEEILVRGILQGWLRRASLTGHLVIVTATLFLAAHDVVQFDPDDKAWSFNEQKILPICFAIALTMGYVSWMYHLARGFKLEEKEIQRWQPQPTDSPLDGSKSPPKVALELRRKGRERDEQRQRRWTGANAWLAIYGSAMLFAVIHSAWPAPVALFLFGLAAAWFNQRTQSLVGPITFHALFNLVAFIALYGSVLTAPGENGNAQTDAVRPSVAASITTSVPISQQPLRK